jgi:hypothetical protein
MASVMATESEVFGSCIGEIDGSVELKNGNSILCCGWKYLRCFWGGKDGSGLAVEVGMVPGIGGHFGLFEGYGRNKKPLW